MDRINVRVSPRLKQQLEAEAKEKGVSPSEIVSQALEEHVRRVRPGESCYDLAKGVDLPAIAVIMRRYEDIGLQFADAALAHLAEREEIHTVFATDRCDFSILRLKRNRALRLIPDVQ